MRMTRRDRIEKIVKALEEQMRALKSIGLGDCASLVRIAWLDLRRRNDRISMRELEVLCDRIADAPCEEELLSGPVGCKKTRRAMPDLASTVARLGGATKDAKRVSLQSVDAKSARRFTVRKRAKKSAHIIDMGAWRARNPRP